MPNDLQNLNSGASSALRIERPAPTRARGQRQRQFQTMVQQYLSISPTEHTSTFSNAPAGESSSSSPQDVSPTDSDSDILLPTFCVTSEEPVVHGLPSPVLSPQRNQTVTNPSESPDPASQSPRQHHNYASLSSFAATAPGLSHSRQRPGENQQAAPPLITQQRASAFADLIQLTSSYLRLQEWVSWSQNAHLLDSAQSPNTPGSIGPQTRFPSAAPSGRLGSVLSQAVRPASPSPSSRGNHPSQTTSAQRRGDRLSTSRELPFNMPRPIPTASFFSPPPPSGHAAPMFVGRSQGRGAAFSKKVVCCLSCKYCDTSLCDRGMKAILLADKGVELYSTDSPPRSVELVNEDYTTRDCACKIRDAACVGCGNVMGYHVTQPCSSCLGSCNNGHFWMFHTSNVRSEDRIIKTEQGNEALLWSQIPSADRDNSFGKSHNEFLSR